MGGAATVLATLSKRTRTREKLLRLCYCEESEPHTATHARNCNGFFETVLTRFRGVLYSISVLGTVKAEILFLVLCTVLYEDGLSTISKELVYGSVFS
jgi:hypothetical protein